MKPIRTWILIADGARARVLKRDSKTAPLKPAVNYDFAAPHAQTQAFDADRPGRGRAPGGYAGHGKMPKNDAHQLKKQAFAKDLATWVNEAAGRNAFDELIVVAPPKILGNLRGDLSAASKAKVKAEVGKDLTHIPLRDLPAHLAAALH